MSSVERRVSQRIPAEFQVNYIHDGDYLISQSRDISVDGMFLCTENPPPVSELTTLSFHIANQQKVELNAEVIWVNKSNESPEESGMAVRFVSPSKDLQELILKIVNRVAVLP